MRKRDTVAQRIREEKRLRSETEEKRRISETEEKRRRSEMD
jgi:hypothetical protein